MTGPDGEPQSAEAVWRAIRSLVLDLADPRREACAALDLSFLRVKALCRLDRGPLTLRELAFQLGVDAPHATVIVDELERRALVSRRPHPTDRRAKLVTLTANGRRAAAKADAILNRPPRALVELSPHELAELDRIVSRLSVAPPDYIGLSMTSDSR